MLTPRIFKDKQFCKPSSRSRTSKPRNREPKNKWEIKAYMPHWKGNTPAEFQKASTVLSDFYCYVCKNSHFVVRFPQHFCYSLTTWSQAWHLKRKKVKAIIMVVTNNHSGKNKFYLLLLTLPETLRWNIIALSLHTRDF